MLIDTTFGHHESTQPQTQPEEQAHNPVALIFQNSSTSKVCGCAPASNKFNSLLPVFEKSDIDTPIAVGSNEIQDSAKNKHNQIEVGTFGYLPDQPSDASTNCLTLPIETTDLDRLSSTPQYDMDSSFVKYHSSESAAPSHQEKAILQTDGENDADDSDTSSLSDYQPPQGQIQNKFAPAQGGLKLPMQPGIQKYQPSSADYQDDEFMCQIIPCFESEIPCLSQDQQSAIGSGLLPSCQLEHNSDPVQSEQSHYSLALQHQYYSCQADQGHMSDNSGDIANFESNPANLTLSYQGSSVQTSPQDYSENPETQENPQTAVSWEAMRTPMIDLLLLFYNKEATAQQPGLLIDNLTPVMDILQKWQAKNLLSPSSLLNFMIDQVAGIVNEVRNKLLYRACYRFQIIKIKMDPTSPESPDELEEQELLRVLTYDQKPGAFDRFIYSLWKYLDMLTRTAEQIEDLYLTIIEQLGLQRPNKYTVFKAVHWQAFRNVILRDSLIRRILDTIDEWRDSGFATNDPGRWLDRVRSIRKLIPQATQSYYQYECEYGRSELLQQACSIAMHPLKMKQFDQDEFELTEQLKSQVQNELKGYYSSDNDNVDDDENDESVQNYDGNHHQHHHHFEFEASEGGQEYYQIPAQQSIDQEDTSE